jgi:hypothetical protein
MTSLSAVSFSGSILQAPRFGAVAMGPNDPNNRSSRAGRNRGDGGGTSGGGGITPPNSSGAGSAGEFPQTAAAVALNALRLLKAGPTNAYKVYPETTSPKNPEEASSGSDATERPLFPNYIQVEVEGVSTVGVPVRNRYLWMPHGDTPALVHHGGQGWRAVTGTPAEIKQFETLMQQLRDSKNSSKS